jgi:hypothetical protein
MKLDVARVDVWIASIEDHPGNLAKKLDTLAKAGVDLEFALARRAPEKLGTGVVFATPIKGARQIKAAYEAGFEKAESIYSLRIVAVNKPGIGARLTKQLGDAGINLRGLSGVAAGNRAVFHLAFDSSADAGKAMRLIRQISTTR